MCTLGLDAYHCTQQDYRTELYWIQVIFGNSSSVITEPICFWKYLVLAISETSGLPNYFGGIVFSNVGGGFTEPKLFWN